MRWTEIPVKLKILKLFIKELGNIAEGEETKGGEVSQDNTAILTGNGDEGWESDEDDEDWDDVAEDGSSDTTDADTQDDILKGINTKVVSSPTDLIKGIYHRVPKESSSKWAEMGIDRCRDRHSEGYSCYMTISDLASSRSRTRSLELCFRLYEYGYTKSCSLFNLYPRIDAFNREIINVTLVTGINVIYGVSRGHATINFDAGGCNTLTVFSCNSSTEIPDKSSFSALT